MTALDRYVRLESTGLWREHADEAAREVLVSFGNATLVLSGFDEEPLTHWSLAAVQILHQDADRTVFAADAPGSETLEIADPQMVEAIAQVRAGLAHAVAPAPVRRGPGRWIAAALGAVVLGLVAWVGPGWLRDVAFGLIPQDKADLIAEDIRVELPPPCSLPEGRRALRSLVATASPGLDAQVMPWDVPRVARLPDGQVLLARSVVLEATAPEAIAGWLALGMLQGAEQGVLRDWVDGMSMTRTLRFLIRADLGAADVATMAAAVRRQDPLRDPASVDGALGLMARHAIPAGPFLRTMGRAGVPEARDPPLLTDQQWVALQQICSS